MISKDLELKIDAFIAENKENILKDIATLIENTINGITVDDKLNFDSIVKYDRIAREFCKKLV